MRKNAFASPSPTGKFTQRSPDSAAKSGRGRAGEGEGKKKGMEWVKRRREWRDRGLCDLGEGCFLALKGGCKPLNEWSGIFACTVWQAYYLHHHEICLFESRGQWNL